MLSGEFRIPRRGTLKKGSRLRQGYDAAGKAKCSRLRLTTARQESFKAAEQASNGMTGRVG